MYLGIEDSWQNVRKTNLHSRDSGGDVHQMANILRSVFGVCLGTTTTTAFLNARVAGVQARTVSQGALLVHSLLQLHDHI